MRDRTVNRVESWDARPFSGGFSTLRDMSEASFSGVVVSGDAWLFMLNGRIVGIVDGDIDDYEDATGTMYEAPDPSLPLLFSMQEREGTTQAKYYTNDTPLADADKTLSDANFTGYVELSENVLSGDYYLVYYGGRALPLAFVGTTNELKTGDEAYELANDEVGVYEVIKTPVNVTQVPGPRSDDADTAPTSGAATGAASAAADGAATEAGVDEEPDVSEESDAATSQSEPESEPAAGSATEPSAEPSAEAAVAEEYDAGVDDPVVESAESADSSPVESAEETPSAAGESSSESSANADPDTAGTAAPSDADAPSDAGTRTEAEKQSEAAEQTEAAGQAPAPESAEDDSSVFSEEEQWRQTKSIPSLSPSEREKRRQQQEARSSGSEQRARRQKSEQAQGATESTQTAGESGSPEQSPTNSSKSSRQRQSESANVEGAEVANTEAGQSKTASSEPDAAESRAQSSGTQPAGAQSTGAQSSGADAEGQPSAKVKQRIADLQAKLERIDAERDGLEDDLESVRAERDSLQRRVRQLENALEEAGGESTAGVTLTPAEALAGTNLFVRYGSRGAPTLDDLTGKNPDPEAINKNLRIDHHTQFESTDASVDGAPFIDFLEETSAYRFVSWLVRNLPYEILDAGHRSDLGELYDVIPEIDRAELQGVVENEGEEGAERRKFDIVLRDRMGNPLVVAELNDERDPVSGDEMEALIESAQVIGDGAEDLGAAFYVTASFFEPNALENAAAATANGGILSRSDRASFVKLARKRGFHLCLAEDRNDTFHLTVPEL